MKNKILIAIGILLVIALGVSFAYFTSKSLAAGQGEATTDVTITVGDTNITVEGTLDFTDLNIYPGHKNISSIKVTATGDQLVLYNLIWTGTNSLNTSLKYTVYKTNDIENASISCEKVEDKIDGNIIYYEECTESNFTNLGEEVASGEISTTTEETTFKLIKNEEIQATSNGNTVYYYVVLEYPNLEEAQNIDMNGSFEGTTSIEVIYEKELSGGEYILANATLATDTPNFANTSCASGTNNGSDCGEATVGLYEAEDDDGISYYYRGDVDNNYVYFAGFYWRIIRVNGDGTIRMIYQGTSADATGEDAQISTSAFNSIYEGNMYVGFMYTSGSVHGLGTSSTIKGVLDTWYTSNLSSYASYIDTNAGFCGDRQPFTSTAGTTEGGGTSTTTYYAAYIRLYTNKAPSYKCTYSEDLYTVSSSTKGNKALSYPIGLITADEVAYAGGVYGTDNTSYYLYTNQDYWTMSPYYFDDMFWSAFVFNVGSTGRLYYNGVPFANGVRPVINLKADITFSGSGTASDPYLVVAE